MAALQLQGLLFYFGLSLTLTGVLGKDGKYCSKYASNIFDDTETFYCEDGCCGDTFNKHCCLDSEVGTIVGIVVGVLFLIGAIVTVVLLIICCKRRPGRGGVVRAPGGTLAYPVVAPPATATTMVSYGGYGQPGVTMMTQQQPFPNQPFPNQPFPNQPFPNQPMAYGAPPYQPEPPKNQAPPAYEEVTHPN